MRIHDHFFGAQRTKAVGTAVRCGYTRPIATLARATAPPAPPADRSKPTTLKVTSAMAGAAVTWASSDAAVATVNATGLVRGVREESATITATARSGSAERSAAITVGH